MSYERLAIVAQCLRHDRSSSRRLGRRGAGRRLAWLSLRGEAMNRTTYRVERYMTRSPHTIGQEQTLTHAHDVMRAHDVRHLPVLQGGKLVGLLSDRDLHLIETLRDVKPDEVLVEEAMTSVVFVVEPKAALGEVVLEMAEHKYGSAVVVDHGKVVGVFTAIDAMRVLGDVLAKPEAA
jgi:acetoin utilization protein AcuB